MIIICSVIDSSLKSDALNALLQEKNKLERANTRLGRLADHDTLTGLYNRRAFERILLKNLAEARQSTGAISIILADLDHFKQYNDSFGHPAGDQVLKRLGEAMSINIRKEDTAARVGGEEFAIILPGVEYEQVIHFGERLRKVIEQDRGAARPITISLGAATYQFRSKSAPMKRIMQQMIAEADRAMYHSKSAGRNQITHFLDLRERDRVK
jgi:diguanylate cyclase (GGDEF)-like protein